MVNRFVTAIYCDDVREEVGNKRSFIGVYSGQLLVPSAPVVLPKLCVIVIIHTPRDRPLTKCVIRILRDGDTLFEMPLEPRLLEEAQNKLKAESFPSDLEWPSIVLHAVAQFSPFAITGECKLRIRVQTEDEELKGPALRVRVAAPINITLNSPPSA